MTSKNLENLVKDYFDLELHDAPYRRRGRTDQCPPLWRFVEVSSKGWSAQEQQHVDGCGYCQKTLAKQWQYSHPNLWQLVLHSLGRGTDQRAMTIHLEEDRCSRCRQLQESRFVKQLIALVRAGSERLGNLEDKVRGMVIGTGGLSYGGAFATTEQIAFQIQSSSVDRLLTATLRRTVSNRLELEIQSPELKRAGRKVSAEVVLQGGEPQVFELTLDSDEDGCFAVHDLGPFSEYARALENCCLIVDWVDEAQEM